MYCLTWLGITASFYCNTLTLMFLYKIFSPSVNDENITGIGINISIELLFEEVLQQLGQLKIHIATAIGLFREMNLDFNVSCSSRNKYNVIT